MVPSCGQHSSYRGIIPIRTADACAGEIVEECQNEVHVTYCRANRACMAAQSFDVHTGSLHSIAQVRCMRACALGRGENFRPHLSLSPSNGTI